MITNRYSLIFLSFVVFADGCMESVVPMDWLVKEVAAGHSWVMGACQLRIRIDFILDAHLCFIFDEPPTIACTNISKSCGSKII